MQTKATRVPTSFDLCWAAGFLNGEGSFTVSYRPKNPNRMPTHVASATQVERWPLEQLQEIFGGEIYTFRKTGVSQWRTNSVRARGIMLTLYSLLSPVKQRQIKTALQGRWKKITGFNRWHGGLRACPVMQKELT